MNLQVYREKEKGRNTHAPPLTSLGGCGVAWRGEAMGAGARCVHE
jgi:hypothetical protein